MLRKALLARIERAEQQAEVTELADSTFSPNCICFPEHKPPQVGWHVELEVAAKVKCPLHGDRFDLPDFFIYVSIWMREKIWSVWMPRCSEQYHKAWHASFPPDVWPAEEGELVDGRVVLRLKDGTELLAHEPAWTRSNAASAPRT